MNPSPPIPADCKVREMEWAPVPHSVGRARLQCNEGVACLGYSVALSHGGGRAEVAFESPIVTYLGLPNDEGLNSHRLWGRGLQPYAFQEVLASDWIASLTKFDDFHHYIVTFQDELFECIARSATWMIKEKT